MNGMNRTSVNCYLVITFFDELNLMQAPVLLGFCLAPIYAEGKPSTVVWHLENQPTYISEKLGNTPLSKPDPKSQYISTSLDLVSVTKTQGRVLNYRCFALYQGPVFMYPIRVSVRPESPNPPFMDVSVFSVGERLSVTVGWTINESGKLLSYVVASFEQTPFDKDFKRTRRKHTPQRYCTRYSLP